MTLTLSMSLPGNDNYQKLTNFKDCLIYIVKVSLSIMQYNIGNFIKYLQAFTWVYNVQFIYT